MVQEVRAGKVYAIHSFDVDHSQLRLNGEIVMKTESRDASSPTKSLEKLPGNSACSHTSVTLYSFGSAGGGAGLGAGAGAGGAGAVLA